MPRPAAVPAFGCPVAQAAGPGSGAAGMISAPNFIAARIVSQLDLVAQHQDQAGRRATPSSRSQLATWLERRVI
ncbi:hypothetical protein E1161_15950 [Saccharopolyspora aridisoli]|uniref:Uncharacterized protein n=1 Tax=Saccharopolyspora aridisoli TaxID=2530385 RepID=A0A4R4UN33_9PSEU|nr:hypothetical protein [Saccharopolyspora aridisoli]TDC91706.1 hypothetical protein E1161_15950 [Saccharopolyspora aridisoli]